MQSRSCSTVRAHTYALHSLLESFRSMAAIKFLLKVYWGLLRWSVFSWFNEVSIEVMGSLLPFDFIVSGSAIFHMLHMTWDPNNTQHEFLGPARFLDHSRDRPGAHHISILQPNEYVICVGCVAQVYAKLPSAVKFRAPLLRDIEAYALTRLNSPLSGLTAVELLARRLTSGVDSVFCEDVGRMLDEPA